MYITGCTLLSNRSKEKGESAGLYTGHITGCVQGKRGHCFLIVSRL